MNFVPGSGAHRAFNVLKEAGREMTSAELAAGAGVAHPRLVQPLLRHAVAGGIFTYRLTDIGRPLAMWGLSEWVKEVPGPRYASFHKPPPKTTGVRSIFDLAEAL
jgi:hypothetical protein